ncbi:PhnD/SsuA/transferrin family substrate-binding protein [Shewanella sp. Isolate13]|uniref:sensor histidine kinase n=1 Tax=Shewanella sp. Isolate13 TaxID=2908531 RepID=UPI001EFE3C80|nr:PhnD/SsuA/transferrin family substrate-binding protein [Shewanella sp. Isolate13]MCG9730749.1 PhnD/SsuA/transferrin family substrate-binding protein [Shewanella sp. Isolate13]
MMIAKLRPLTTISCLILSCFIACYSYAQQLETIRVGVLAFTHPDNVAKRWQPTIDKISADLNRPFELIALTPSELDSKVAQGKLDFLITNALTGVSYKKDFGTTSLLTLVPKGNNQPTHAVGSALITRQEQQVNSFDDLKALRAVSTDKQAFGGFQIFAGEMAHNDLNPFNDFKTISFVGFPQQKLLSLVVNGDADIAILPTCVLENAINNGDIAPNSLKVVLTKPNETFHCQTSSQLYPYYSFSKLGKTDHRVATDVIRSLLSIKPSEQAAIIGRYDSWSATVNDSHVFKLLKQLRRWPFVTNWTSIFRTALPWGVAIAIFLLLGYIHHLRVKRLVVLRTRALQAEVLEHTQTQKALLEQTKQFYKAQRVLLTGEMASGIAHELNQPLAGIRYLTQGCIYRLSEEQSDLKDAMNKAIQQVDRAQSTIKRFRHFCQQPSVMSECSLNQVLEETLALMGAEFARMQLTPIFTSETVKLTADPSLLQQVFVNIIRNAIDAMDKSPVPSLSITLSKQAQQASIVFTDNGTGLSETALERLFFPFETSKEHGLGLGMIICKRIIEEHNGEIVARNNRDSDASKTGLTITITLPIKET